MNRNTAKVIQQNDSLGVKFLICMCERLSVALRGDSTPRSIFTEYLFLTINEWGSLAYQNNNK